jgi:hypothetical protein
MKIVLHEEATQTRAKSSPSLCHPADTRSPTYIACPHEWWSVYFTVTVVPIELDAEFAK